MNIRSKKSKEEISPIYPYYDDVEEAIKSGRKKPIAQGVDGRIIIENCRNLYIPHLMVSELGIEDAINFAMDHGSNGSVVYGILQYLVFTECRDMLYVYFTYKSGNRVLEQLKLDSYPQSSFSRGVSKLKERRIITRHPNGVGWYWFNASRIYNGDLKKVLEGRPQC